MQRLFMLMSTLVVWALVGPGALAQGGTPAAGARLDGHGLPELRVSISGTGIDVADQIEAGRYLVVLENASPYDVEVTFFLPPDGLTADQLMATPAGEAEPAWFYEATIASGVSAEPGGTDQTVLDLSPAGEWVVDVGRFPDEAAGVATPADFQESTLFPLDVSGDAGTPPDVSAGAMIEMDDFDFTIPDQMPAGAQIWAVTNAGQQPHHLVLSRAATAVTDAQVDEWLAFEFGMAPAGATPAPDLPTFESFTDVDYIGVLSAGRTAWVDTDLTPGTYVAFCFVSDRESGMPHAAMGMVEVFTVDDAGTPPA